VEDFEESKFYTVKDTASMLGVSRQTVYHAIQRGDIEEGEVVVNASPGGAGRPGRLIKGTFISRYTRNTSFNPDDVDDDRNTLAVITSKYYLVYQALEAELLRTAKITYDENDLFRNQALIDGIILGRCLDVLSRDNEIVLEDGDKRAVSRAIKKFSFVSRRIALLVKVSLGAISQDYTGGAA